MRDSCFVSVGMRPGSGQSAEMLSVQYSGRRGDAYISKPGC